MWFSTVDLCVVSLIILFQTVSCANILFVAITPAVSHQKPFQPVWRELSLRGHNVHVVTPSPLKDPSLTNLTEYDLSSLFEPLKNPPKQMVDYLLRKPDFPTVFIKDGIMTKIWSKISEVAFNHSEVQRLLKKDLKFDVAIIEWLYPTMAGFGAKYQCPIIGIASLGVPLVGLDTVGNPSHPVASPDHNLPVTRDMPFRERLLSGLYSIYVRVYYHLVVLPREDGLVKKYLGQDLPYLGDIERNVSLLLLNRNPVFHRVMPMNPTVIELGTMKYNRTKQVLEPDLKKFLDNSKNGALYFSLGSNLKSTYLSDKLRETFLTTFSRLPYNVVFKWENDTLPGKPTNVFISKWIPQVEVLEHPNVKLFVMQGGLQSTEEAILAEMPIIGFPTHSDQTANVDTFAKYGVGIALDLEDVTVEKFYNAITEVMTKPSYKENAKMLASLMYDQPIDPLERAVWWVEYVIRHKGAKHLRSTVMDIPWWQYLLLDVLGFLLAIVSIAFLVFYFVLKGIYLLMRATFRKICGKENNVDEKKKKL